MDEIDRDGLTAAVKKVLIALADPDLFAQDRAGDWLRKRAKIDALIEERKLEELDGGEDENGFCGRYRYHLESPIEVGTGIHLKHLTFRSPTFKDLRDGAGMIGESWVMYLIGRLSKECRTQVLIDLIDAQDYDDLSEVVQFPFERRPSRTGEPASSGGKSLPH